MTKSDHQNSNNKYIIFYDGDCGFCNRWVQWVLKHDHHNRFLFSSLQSPFGQQFLTERGISNQSFDSIFLWKPNEFYLIEYQAVLKIAITLGGIYSIALVGKLIPETIGNHIYRIISKNRKRLSNNYCYVPTKEQRKKFII